MSILRNSAIAALVAGAAVAAPAAASASTTQASVPAAHTAASAPNTVHRAHCTGNTFNLYEDFQEVCYAGTGSGPDTPGVYQVTTGRYWGCMLTRSGNSYLFRSFSPRQTIRFGKFIDVRSFTLSDKPIVCPM